MQIGLVILKVRNCYLKIIFIFAILLVVVICKTCLCNSVALINTFIVPVGCEEKIKEKLN